MLICNQSVVMRLTVRTVSRLTVRTVSLNFGFTELVVDFMEKVDNSINWTVIKHEAKRKVSELSR